MDNSPLKGLPAEIRNNIYELALTQDGPVMLGKEDSSWSWRRISDTKTQPLALTKTCKAIHSECTQLFYSINTFILRVGANISQYGLRLMVHRFRMGIGAANFSALRDVKVDFGEFSYQGRNGLFLMDLQHFLPWWPRLLFSVPDVDALRIKFSTSADASSGSFNSDHELSLIKLADDWDAISDKLDEEHRTMLFHARSPKDRHQCEAFGHLVKFVKSNRQVVLDMEKHRSGKILPEQD
jgi:hypothetical protein